MCSIPALNATGKFLVHFSPRAFLNATRTQLDYQKAVAGRYSAFRMDRSSGVQLRATQGSLRNICNSTGSRAVAQAAREGTLLMRDAYRLTGLSGRTFERFTKGLSERIGG